MSALPPKADIRGSKHHVRECPLMTHSGHQLSTRPTPSGILMRAGTVLEPCLLGGAIRKRGFVTFFCGAALISVPISVSYAREETHEPNNTA